MDFDRYHLLYNAAAHFAAMEKYPDGLTGALTEGGFAGLEAVCWALETMSVQGELARRYMGHDKGETIKAAEALVMMTPMEGMVARNLVIAAMTQGLKVAGGEDEEIDEVLAELEKKTETD